MLINLFLTKFVSYHMFFGVFWWMLPLHTEFLSCEPGTIQHGFKKT